MTENNFDIKFNEHYKLYVLLKDKIIFETELQKNGIKYYSEINEQTSIDGGIRYFLLDSDMEKIDRIIIKNGIVANTESNLVMDYGDQAKMIKLYTVVFGAVVGIIVLILIVSKIFN